MPAEPPGTGARSRLSGPRAPGSRDPCRSPVLTRPLVPQRLQPSREERLHCARTTLQDLGHLDLGQVLVEREDDGGTLPLREALERSPELLSVLRRPILPLERGRVERGLGSLEVHPFHPLPTKVG